MLALLVVGLLIPAVFVGVMYSVVMKRKLDMRKALQSLQDELAQKAGLRDQLHQIYSQTVGILELAAALKELQALQESLKAEKGRITITQTELETVETRLCELEEIERELEASGVETKEELKILKKKETDLKNKNEALKNQIAMSVQQLEITVKELNISTEHQERIDKLKAELVRTEEKIETLVLQIEGMNEQYVNMKRRYDALDIEYAQLYEKFSDAEAMMQAQQEQPAG